MLEHLQLRAVLFCCLGMFSPVQLWSTWPSSRFFAYQLLNLFGQWRDLATVLQIGWRHGQRQ
jgi:hypothetical protein